MIERAELMEGAGNLVTSGRDERRGGSGATPACLRPVPNPTIVLIDVDNLVIDPDGRIDPAGALASLEYVHRRTARSSQSLAVVSASAADVIGPELWFRFPGWTWRFAHVGPDAADHQLLDFAAAVRGQRPGAAVAVASGDGIFTRLAEGGPLEVVVPFGHRVARVLQPHLRPRPTARDHFDLAT